MFSREQLKRFRHRRGELGADEDLQLPEPVPGVHRLLAGTAYYTNLPSTLIRVYSNRRQLSLQTSQNRANQFERKLTNN
jgi:hypothetical protein